MNVRPTGRVKVEVSPGSLWKVSRTCHQPDDLLEVIYFTCSIEK